MTSFQIVAREDKESKKMARKMTSVLLKHDWISSSSPDIVISIGGDGTMLKAFKEYYHEKTTFIAIHTGTLGFYADWDKNEMDELLSCLLHQPLTIVDYPLLEGRIIGKKCDKTFLSLNEFVIKSQTLSTFVMDVFINGNHFQTFRGDGMIAATPTGSTAYSHSLDGSILHPSLEVLQISELAAINNKAFRTLNRSIVLPKHHLLEFRPKNKASEILLGVDGFEMNTPRFDSIFLRVSDKKIKFIRFRPFPFWDRVKEKFLT